MRNLKFHITTSYILIFSILFPVAFGLYHTLTVAHEDHFVSLQHEQFVGKPGLKCNHTVFFNFIAQSNFTSGVTIFIPVFNYYNYLPKPVAKQQIPFHTPAYRGPPVLIC